MISLLLVQMMRHIFGNLEGALERMSSMGIKLKKEKCEFMKPSVEYFAFVVFCGRPFYSWSSVIIER